MTQTNEHPQFGGDLHMPSEITVIAIRVP